MRFVPLLLTTGLAPTVALHVLPQRQLIAVNSSFGDLRSVLGHADREDFEAIFHDHVVVWANQSQMAELEHFRVPFREVDNDAYNNFLKHRRQPYHDEEGREPNWGRYCGYNCLSERLRALARDGGCEFPLELQSIGSSCEDRHIWAVKVGRTGPEVLMAANIHGNEPVGGQLLQRWLWSTCRKPDASQVEVAKSVQAWYVLMLNPDGFEQHSRWNAAGADLNRDMPTPHGGSASQPETRALVSFEEQHAFVSALMFHGGAMVCNTPYDSCYAPVVSRPCPPALAGDDTLITANSRAYCDPLMASGGMCSFGTDCQTNGASWYQIEGSVQDYEYFYRGTLSVTMEIWPEKFPPSSDLPALYTVNQQSIHNFMMFAVEHAKEVHPRGLHATQEAAEHP
mmetsp:Transcript_48172/g.111604  ORF Transcript_48172/g.111604 Transcript_48172/m.111604 type:complete len:397 (+) Transcript_48172:113-1303(+)|eukprot:CAMPEP_0171069996 /NCGR_PEP_ID=MMETSP0766_2-20121228/9474_1 /TAXON_ID=439317 /ORGANISM="Gambierdiscus australes, Strain CAWD 149" /LENGTH=396 /DNA_ID=CAMNT_0011526421 /DNA_START=87 /DNA_END=1277 /DNA_ORIENTATION=+